MERLTVIEYDTDHAMHPRTFESLTRGSSLQQLRDWLASLGEPPATFRVGVSPQPEASDVLRYGDGSWGIVVHLRTVRHEFTPYGTFAEAASHFVGLASRDGRHWLPVEPLTRPGEELLLARLPQVVAWVRHAASRIDRLIARQVMTDIAVRDALEALARNDPAAALTSLAPTQDQVPIALLTALGALADLLVMVAEDDPPSYVTSLEMHARTVVEAAGLRRPPTEAAAAAEPRAAA